MWRPLPPMLRPACGRNVGRPVRHRQSCRPARGGTSAETSRVGEQHAPRRAVSTASTPTGPARKRGTVGGQQVLPAGGQQTLPTHDHLLTQRARSGRHDSLTGAVHDRHIGNGGPWSSDYRSPRVTTRADVADYAGRKMQNSLLSGSAMTTQSTSPWPMSTRVAPSATRRRPRRAVRLGRAARPRGASGSCRASGAVADHPRRLRSGQRRRGADGVVTDRAPRTRAASSVAAARMWVAKVRGSPATSGSTVMPTPRSST
jgi:hypothetical protein